MFAKDETQRLAEELKAIPQGRKRTVIIGDSRRFRGGRVGPSRTAIIQAELAKANSAIVMRFLNQCIDLLRSIPKLRKVVEIERYRYASGPGEIRVVENGAALEGYQQLILSAMVAVREMANRASTPEVQAAISDWQSKIERFDTTRTTEGVMNERQFNDLRPKGSDGVSESAVLTSDGPQIIGQSESGRIAHRLDSFKNVFRQ